MAIVLSAMSSWRKRRRADEQRWPALSKAEKSASSTTCSMSAVEVHDHGVEPAGLGDEGHDGSFARGERRVDRARGFGRAGEGDARNARIAHELRAHALARAGKEMQDVWRHARLVQQPHGLVGDKRRLLGGLGDHCVARGECRRHLAREDREREVPWAYAGEDAAAAQALACCARRWGPEARGAR